MNVLKILFDHYSDNASDTPEMHDFIDVLGRMPISDEERTKAWKYLGMANYANGEQAFSAGFKAAMALFINQDVVTTEGEDNS